MKPETIPDALRDYFAGSTIALSLGSMSGDQPLLLANAPFCALTGYAESEILGLNCRFLQHPCHNDVNISGRAQVRAFLHNPQQEFVRASIVNVRRDGCPFVNLLYMSKLRDWSGRVHAVLASQFDVSCTYPQMLRAYDTELGNAMVRLRPALAQSGVLFDGALSVIVNSAAAIAQAKMTLARVSGRR